MERLAYPARRKLGTAGLLAALAACALPTVLLAEHFDPRRRGEPPERILYLPKGDTLKFMSLGYRGIAADFIWIRSVMYVGRKITRNEQNYEWLAKLYQVTTDLDPHWKSPYRGGALLMSALPQDDHRALLLLHAGMARNPWDVKIPEQIAQLHLLRGKREEALRYFKLIDRCMSNAPPQASIMGPDEDDLKQALKHIGPVIQSLEVEGGNYPAAVKISVKILSETDDKLIREVTGRGYREALARLVAWELGLMSASFRKAQRRNPTEIAELLGSDTLRRFLTGRLAVPLGGDGPPDFAAAAKLVAGLPADTFGMEYYVRPDGTVHSQGVERLELFRILGVVNGSLKRLGQNRGFPARNLGELVIYLRELQRTGRMPSGATEFFGRPARLPAHPMGSGNWGRMKLDEDGLVIFPEGPEVAGMFAVPMDLPAGPGGRAGGAPAP